MKMNEYYGGQPTAGSRQRIRQRLIAKLKEYPGLYRATRLMYRRIWPKEMP